ncbi:MAG: SUMF1/EgtB/PvdO family nonheme iron enzyme [Verrucomicrobiota bacterium]|jgi:formylglycine-generating enzyme required for sulfatase activity
MSDKLHPIPQALRDAIRNRQVVVVVGAGVSIQATGNAPAASWKGLIRLGIEACPRWNSELNKAWVKRKLDELQSADRIGLIGLADEVRRRIGTTNGRLEEWLRETVGQLKVKTPTILDALHALGCPIVTTNYDGLLDRNGLSAVTWQQAGPVDRIIRGEDKGIIHLHGRFDEPDSVVLGIEDYAAVRDGAFAKAVREALAMTRTLLFVGCGDGLSDPNFTTFRRWMATVLSNRSSSHYRLCCDDERQALEKEHEDEERIDLVPYGEHEDLPGFLQKLAPESIVVTSGQGAASGHPEGSNAPSDTVPPQPFTQAIQAYLRHLSDEVQHLRLVGFGHALDLELPIEDAYVPLRLLTSASLAASTPGKFDLDELESRGIANKDVPVSGMFQLAHSMGYRGVVVLGDPGSGKTTAARQLCRAILKDADPATTFGLPVGVVPVLIRLRDLRPEQMKDPWAFVDASVRPEPVAVAGAKKRKEAGPGPDLRSRKGVLWIFDGLDEVVDEPMRVRVTEWMARVLDERREDRFMVTCRYSGYQGDVALGPGFCKFNVQPLDATQVREFVERWHRVVARRIYGEGPKATERANESIEALMGILGQEEYRIGRLRELPANPLLLTILCLVHHEQKNLPGRRVDLYARCTRVLVEEWNKEKLRRSQATPMDAGAAEEVLASVAWWLHSEDQRTSDTMETLGAKALPMLESMSSANGLGRDGKQFIERMRDLSGIMAMHGAGRCGFLHLTFQEYLAASHATRAGLAGQLATELGRTWWREMILLAVAMGTKDFATEFFTTATRVDGAVVKHEALLTQAIDESRHVIAKPFVTILEDPKRDDGEKLAALRIVRERGAKEVVEACRGLVEAKSADLARLAEEVLLKAGEAVPPRTRRGVRRRGAGDASLPIYIEPKTGMTFVELPAGEFQMGSDGSLFDDESPVHPVRVSAFRMGRYPVTNAEYAKFLAAHPGAPKPLYWDDSQFNDPRQPVVGIDWNQASEFCRWLGGRLPTEAEWEYACRAGTTTEYAFGKDLSHEQVNFGRTVGRTTPVDHYPANSWGFHDMHGNVWEWCADWYGEKYYASSPSVDPQGPIKSKGRVSRGGGWSSWAWNCRSARRCDWHPGDRNSDKGFRVVIPSRSAS